MASTGLNQLTFAVDFNATSGDLIIARRADASSDRRPREGMVVLMTDEDGNECEGMVREVRARTVLIRPMLWTWTHPADVEVSGIRSSGAGSIQASELDHTYELAV